MLPKSHDRRDGVIPFGKLTEPEIAMAVSHVTPHTAREKHGDESMHIFWRVFGGAILSIAALIGITLYNSLQSGITELRGEIAKLHDSRTEMVRKDEFNGRITASHERINTVLTQCTADHASIVALKTDLDGQKERLTKSATDHDTLRKETLATIEVVKKDVAALESAKEKLTTLTAELKQTRDDLSKVRTEVERNQIADQERKARRDEQAKEHEKVLKELTTALADCREKLARLEGQQQAAPAKAKEMP